MWQTNGMGNAWWQTNATVAAGGVITAKWVPEMYPGAGEVAFFMPVQSAGGASYRAAGRIRFRPSPGAGSQTIDLPQPGGSLDFSAYQLVNAPWATLDAVNSAIDANNAIIDAAITSATGAIVIPPAVDLGPYATTGMVADAVQASGNALAGQINAVSNAAMQRAEMGGYATRQDVSTAIAGIPIPSLEGYATEQYVGDAIAAIELPSLDGYATTAYANAAASNAQATAMAAIPSLAGYATQEWAADYVDDRFAQGVVIQAQTTRLATLDGDTWQDATGVVWHVDRESGWSGTIWTNNQEYSVSSTGYLYQVEFYPAGTNAMGFTSYTNAVFGEICFDTAMTQGWVYAPEGFASGAIVNGAGEGDTNVYTTAATEWTTGKWVSADLSKGPVGQAATNPVDRVLYESSGGAEIPEELSSITNAVKYYGGFPTPALTYGWYFSGTASHAQSANRLKHPQMIQTIDLYLYENQYGGMEYRWASRSGIGPTNFFAYVSELPAPSVPSAPEVTTALRWRADGTACVVTVAAGGTLTADTSNWTEGQAVMAIITLADGAGIEQGIELVGYGAWPVGTPFVACCYRIGLTVFVVPSTTL